MLEARLNGDGILFKFTEYVGSLNGFLVNLPMDVLNSSILKCYYTNNELFYSLGDHCTRTPARKTGSLK